MAKSLGQIHTVNYTLSGSGTGDRFLIDLPGELTSQLQHMVRMCSSFKVVGIDVTMTDPFTGAGGQTLSGEFQYYAPTRGRVLAVREAYEAVMRAMAIKGIKPLNNLNYDFRPPLEPTSNFINGASFLNAASIQFDDIGLVFEELAIENNPGFQTVFDIWNAQQQPQQTAPVSFSTGYDVVLGGRSQGLGGISSSPDFVLNEGEYLQNTSGHFANTGYESIPFAVANSDGTSMDLATQWRPDPALYLSVLLGQFCVNILEYTDVNPGNFYNLEVAVHVAGWKGILSDRKHRRSKKGKSHGRKRHSKR